MFEKMNSWMTRIYVRQEIVRHEMKQTLTNQRGAGAVEYGLVIAVVVLMVIAAAAVMREPLEGFFRAVVAKIQEFLAGD